MQFVIKEIEQLLVSALKATLGILMSPVGQSVQQTVNARLQNPAKITNVTTPVRAYAGQMPNAKL